MSNYTFYEIYDLTNAPKITKRKIAHGGDLHDVAREVCGKSIYLSAPSIENGRAIIRVFGTDTVAYVIAPQKTTRAEQSQNHNFLSPLASETQKAYKAGYLRGIREGRENSDRARIISLVKSYIWANKSAFDGEYVYLDDMDIDHIADNIADEMAGVDE